MHPRHLTLLALIAVLTLFVGANADARIYRWVDDNGKVHYSWMPPKAQQTTLVETPPGVRPTASETAREVNETIEEAALDAEEPTPTDEEVVSERRKTCNSARETIRLLRTHPRLMMVDPESGEERLMTPEEKIERRKLEERIAREFCG